MISGCHPQSTVDIALLLSAIGVLDRENAQICGVSIGAIQHWRAGRRRVPSHRTAAKANTCPHCHGRPLDEPAYAYLLGVYLGGGHIVHGPKDVYVLAVACFRSTGRGASISGKSSCASGRNPSCRNTPANSLRASSTPMAGGA
jgi:hypothetical protein